MKPNVSPLDWDLGNIPPGIPWGGVDEAGRGAWAGPVVAACAVLDRPTCERWGHVLRSAKDSKKLSPQKRASLAAELKTVLPAYAIAEVDNLAIDRENILVASMEAMRQAVSNLELRPRILLVDGDRAPRTGLPERLVVEGDALSCAIACASILAKTHRDALLVGMEETHPGYGFAKHKGYGTPEHRKALQTLGTCAIHRLSYAPVAALQQPDEEALRRVSDLLLACHTVEELQAWVGHTLRPAYGLLKAAWVDDLREHYARRLAGAAGPGA